MFILSNLPPARRTAVGLYDDSKFDEIAKSIDLANQVVAAIHDRSVLADRFIPGGKEYGENRAFVRAMLRDKLQYMEKKCLILDHLTNTDSRYLHLKNRILSIQENIQRIKEDLNTPYALQKDIRTIEEYLSKRGVTLPRSKL